MPLLDTTGNDSADAYGGGAATVFNYIENVFSTWLYTGTGATQTITNNIDLSTKGGLTWIKTRSAAANNCLFDTVRGATKYMNSNATTASTTDANGLTAFNTTGFTLGSGNTSGDEVNTSGATFSSWTFRKQSKFFDIVTYTGDGNSGQTIAHNLGTTPGFMIVKNTATANWFTYHTSLGATYGTVLNSTNASAALTAYWNDTSPTSTNFTVGSSSNSSGQTYIAYLFAHNAGGFGLTGTDNVITCGSFTIDGTGGTSPITLGYEPQWILTKQTNTSAPWAITDTMRGWSQTNSTSLQPNSSVVEGSFWGTYLPISSTGFKVNSGAYTSGDTFIYIAIRRGPMAVPTDATKVFLPQSPNSSGSFPCVVTNFPVDMGIVKTSKVSVGNNFLSSRLQGQVYMYTNTTAAEASDTSFEWDSNTGWLNLSNANLASWNFQRAPSFFDEVCYTGTGSVLNVSHNLTVVPELIIAKHRNGASYGWAVYSATLGNTKYLSLNNNNGPSTAAVWNNVNPTSTIFTLGAVPTINSSGINYVAYLFATCAGVSKVGSYTGTGATQTINCGFTGGARFVLIRRVDATGGDWYVWDTARGMVSGTNPSLLLDTTAAQVNANSVYTTTGGFQIVSTVAGINASGVTYIFLAIA
jgi:hypothetical protein